MAEGERDHTDGSELDIRVLGPLTVLRDGSTVDISGPKLRLVLTALVVARGRVVSMDRLVELIWAGDPPAKPSITVRSYISNLRRLLEPGRSPGDRGGILLTQSPGYRLAVEPHVVDAFRFESSLEQAERLLAAGRHEDGLVVLDQALALWRTDHLDDSPLAAFVGEADRLVELHKRAVGQRFDALLGLGRHLDIIPDLRARVDHDPTDEGPLAQLMLALARAGRSSEAVEAYQSGLRAIVDVSGLDGSRQLAELERQILTNDPAIAWRPSETNGTAGAEVGRPVGRAAETELLVDAVCGQTGSLVAITGEPGIGKSMLLRYGADRAAGAGITVATGYGHNGSQATPLVPWRTALASLVERLSDQDLTDACGDRAAELATIVPDIGSRLSVEAVTPRDVQALNESVVRFIRHLGSSGPVLLCFDDLHWADIPSIRLLTYLVPAVDDLPTVVAATWRDTEHLGDELAAALTEVGRLAAGHRIALDGLTVDAVAELVTGFLYASGDDDRGTDTSPALDDALIVDLQARTSGNPLFITELLRSSPDLSALTMTATIDDVISGRLADLPDGCRDLLLIGAMCSGDFNEALLSELAGLSGDELLDRLDVLLGARLIVEAPSDPTTFSFTHPLIGECVAAKVSGLRKAKLHTRIAGVLEQQQVSIGQLAHHLLRGASAGDPVAAASSALDAARAAARLHDHAGAIDLIERGLAALERTDDDQLRAELMVELAHERKHLEHYTQSHAAAQQSFRLAKRAGDLDLMVKATLVFCGQSIDDNHFGLSWLGYWNPPGPALDMLRECLEKLPAGELRVVALVAYASQLFGEFADPAEAAFMLEEATAEARQTPSRPLLSGVLQHKLTTLQRTLSFEQREALVSEALDLAISVGQTNREIAIRRARTVLCFDGDDLDGAIAESRTCRDLARQVDDQALAMLSESMPIAIDLYRGHLDRAEAALGDAMVTYERMGAAALDVFGIQLAVLHRERGNLAEVEAMMRWKVTGYPGPAYGMALAMVLAEQGDDDAARQVLAEYTGDSIETGGEPVLQFMTLAFHAEAAVALGDRDRAEVAYRSMGGAAGRTVAMFNGIAFFGSGSLYLGRLATLLGRYDEAAAHLAAAAEHHDRVGARPYQLRTALALADLADAGGRTDDARVQRNRANRLAGQLGMTWLVERSQR